MCAYLHIENLYKNQIIMAFKECYALEKIHGSSAHIAWNCAEQTIKFFSGGESHVNFVALFNVPQLHEHFSRTFPCTNATIYGEVYGGKCQGMSHTYGKSMRFTAFDVEVGECWLDVPKAESVVTQFGLEFVHYVKIPTTIEAMNEQRDKPSTQAKRCGIVEDKIQEGVVLRPLFEVKLNNGSRVIVKHKRDEFRETKSPRVVDDEKLKVLKEAEDIAEEWVTEMRLTHVLDKLPADINVEQTRDVIFAMTADIKREAEGEIEMSFEAEKAIGKRTARLFKARIQAKLNQN